MFLATAPFLIMLINNLNYESIDFVIVYICSFSNGFYYIYKVLKIFAFDFYVKQIATAKLAAVFVFHETVERFIDSLQIGLNHAHAYHHTYVNRQSSSVIDQYHQSHSHSHSSANHDHGRIIPCHIAYEILDRILKLEHILFYLDESFWSLCSSTIVETIHILIFNEGNEQYVTAQVQSILKLVQIHNVVV
ncbi:unnamed protein product [Adineta ricciae]|uniref:Uncharacterized protein n=1 Tax=Adineta ricciae TaxID=249248 RepID=A0A814YPS5_ADIRI|nr:unnamed protein product [Adineta ricciae]